MALPFLKSKNKTYFTTSPLYNETKQSVKFKYLKGSTRDIMQYY